MKIRNGFVSNSSSSSFVINLNDVSANQLIQIQNHQVEGDQLGISYANSDPWNIDVTNNIVEGSTSMDNFDMQRFLKEIGISSDVITWDQ